MNRITMYTFIFHLQTFQINLEDKKKTFEFLQLDNTTSNPAQRDGSARHAIRQQMRHVEKQLVEKYDHVIKTLQESMELGIWINI